MSDRALALAMMGDDVFFAAIEAADRGTYGISCPCGCYHVARIAAGTDNAICPECGSGRGSCESPALGSGPSSVQNQGDDGGEPVLATLYFGEPGAATRAALAEAQGALREHHNWHLSQDRDANAWGIDPVDAYSGSGLCERTVNALALKGPTP